MADDNQIPFDFNQPRRRKPSPPCLPPRPPPPRWKLAVARAWLWCRKLGRAIGWLVRNFGTIRSAALLLITLLTIGLTIAGLNHWHVELFGYNIRYDANNGWRLERKKPVPVIPPFDTRILDQPVKAKPEKAK